MIDELIFSRDYSEERKALEKAADNYIPSSEDKRQMEKTKQWFHYIIENAEYRRNEKRAAIAGRLATEALMISDALKWDISISETSTAIDISIKPTELFDLTILNNLILHANPFGIKLDGQNKIILTFCYPTVSVILPDGEIEHPRI